MRCRRNIGRLLNIADFQKIYFTSGATESLNILIRGLSDRCRCIVSTAIEHNSVNRPLAAFYPDKDITIIGCDGYGRIDIDELEKCLRTRSDNSGDDGISLLIVNHCSNVTGCIQDIASITNIAHRYNFLVLIDLSQSAGCIPVDFDGWDIDMIAFTGHKSLFGPQGTGGYYFKSSLDIKPLMYGGTGRDSSRIAYNGDYEYEVGTMNETGIAGLNAGVEYLLSRGVKNVFEDNRKKVKYLYNALSLFGDKITIYGSYESCQGPVMSFNIRGMKPSDVGYILEKSYGIIVRTGLQCAPLIHKYLQSPDGTVRVSVSDMTEYDDLDVFISAMKDITNF